MRQILLQRMWRKLEQLQIKECLLHEVHLRASRLIRYVTETIVNVMFGLHVAKYFFLVLLPHILHTKKGCGKCFIN